ncbi:DUF2752 domain-containing protein [Winogradskyella aquimaris]|uniref:DUF2752 domain-containing protein n=1 Tax=Winogradskyella aquimaris TaxID=864074 RepID=A0ABU5EKP0_9FLAO|nr:DUF2752 domain-containing protein [Winogradskyella aquimaris]MDY2586872.1 DUF2752 domain-containing protein [Winogradskyella aquimaris]
MVLFIKNLEDYMLPCVNKTLFGYECMGCGLQRSAALLLRGQVVESFLMYPGLYTLMALFGFIALNTVKNFKNGTKIIAILAILNVVVIIISYLLKLYLK